MFLAKSVALVSDVHIRAVIEMINLAFINIYGVKNNVIMNMVFVDMSG